MIRDASKADSQALLQLAGSPGSTPFDYVIVGSGAGGGPLAARLALGGQSVLLIEAGTDPATSVPGATPSPRPVGPGNFAQGEREVYAVPAFFAAASEDPEMSWGFSVRHYAVDAQQIRDTKYDALQDPFVRGDPGKGGIQYPRAAAIGGCTAHHAMIIIRPNDADWDSIAELTDDSSWRSENMQGYFAKIENCLYYAVYRGFIGKMLGGLLSVVQWLATQLNPRRQLDTGGHGFNGWQPTSFIDPLVIAGIVRGDWTFLRVLRDVVFTALANTSERSMLGAAIGKLQILQFLDPNVRSPDIPTRAHMSLISIGTDGKRREGLREHLVDVANKMPERLVLLHSAHATRLLFETDPPDGVPRAVGVEILPGAHLYGASPKAQGNSQVPQPRQVFCRREVIVCGGAFNTPQLLMLSGIGDREHLEKIGIDGPRDDTGKCVAGIVDLPGVGLNLQDRYEVSVISKAKAPFSSLDGVSFRPEQSGDPARAQWLQDGTGLYSTNGGAIAFMLSSTPNAAERIEPDLFFFGVPVAFRGYYWGWSKDLLRETRDATTDSRDLWTWVILKAYTHNDHGSVRLSSKLPLDTPQIDFRSFDDQPASLAGTRADVESLCEAVEAVRGINEKITVFEKEVWPNTKDKSALRQWIRDEAWGHHACGTCRIGADAWRADPSKLEDKGAVLDSRFRVHGVRNLRVVDASIFPSIPGYFLVAPTFMIGEKAADVLLADSTSYPRLLEEREATAIRERREQVGTPPPPFPLAAATLPNDTIGLALSGGGIRSATFSLGVLQALAMRRRLRDIDVVSSVSGGGFIASFLGRLFTRLPSTVRDKPGRVESVLANTTSEEIGWLRSNAEYIDGGGRGDALFDVAVVLRNLVSVYLWLGTLWFGVFGLLRWFAIVCLADDPAPTLFAVPLSAWWCLPALLFTFGVLPPSIGYWLVLRGPRGTWRASLPFLLWLVLVGCAIYGLSLPAIEAWSAVAIVVLMLAWLAQGIASWGVPIRSAAPRWGQPDDPGQAKPMAISTVARNRLTRFLGTAVFGLLVSLVWVVLDTVAQYLVLSRPFQSVGWSMLGFGPLLPLLRAVAAYLLKRRPQSVAASANGLGLQIALAVLAFVLVFVLACFLDALVYLVLPGDSSLGRWWVLSALLTSAVVGSMLSFLNLSSLQQAYSQKLVRVFLGASNDARVHPSGTNAPVPADVSDLSDDMDFDNYHPERAGGPLHLVNCCVNNTVDPLSGNQLRDDRGMAMCVGPAGVSVGRRFHGLWEPRSAGTPSRSSPVVPVRVDPDPSAFHVLARSDGKPSMVERLRLGQWMAISGAAYTTGSGRSTQLGKSLLLGLLNIRSGYWWNSGIAAGSRPGRYPPSAWRRIKALPAKVFRLQASLLNEWRAHFAGPAQRWWYLSDGGHFDNTGLYELIRRRLPIIIAVDASRDQAYSFADLALLTRQVRVDFSATLTWLDPTAIRRSQAGVAGWKALAASMPPWITSHVNPEAIGAIGDFCRAGPRGATLAHITYADDSTRASWLLLLKPCLLAHLPTDVTTYAALHEAFPNQTTLDQFFDDDQWEAYRMLGLSAGMKVFS